MKCHRARPPRVVGRCVRARDFPRSDAAESKRTSNGNGARLKLAQGQLFSPQGTRNQVESAHPQAKLADISVSLRSCFPLHHLHCQSPPRSRASSRSLVQDVHGFEDPAPRLLGFGKKRECSNHRPDDTIDIWTLRRWMPIGFEMLTPSARAALQGYRPRRGRRHWPAAVAAAQAQPQSHRAGLVRHPRRSRYVIRLRPFMLPGCRLN